MAPSAPSQKQLSSSRMWHTDSSYRPTPSVGSLLHGIEISRTGGITQFINMYRVYDDLPDSLRRQVEGRRARHDFSMLHRLVGSPPPTPEEQAAMPPVWHPMVRRHPVTGAKSLYISSIYNDAVEGLADAAARKLIEDLSEFAAQPQYMYRHVWEPRRRADVGQPLHRPRRHPARSRRTSCHAPHDHRRHRTRPGLSGHNNAADALNGGPFALT